MRERLKSLPKQTADYQQQKIRHVKTEWQDSPLAFAIHRNFLMINIKECDIFIIGVFSSFENAEQIAEEMLKNVSGFKDYPCKYEITAKNVIGETDEFVKI